MAAMAASPRVVALRHDPSLVKLAEPHGEPYSNPADDQADEDEEEEDEEDGEDAIEVAPRKHVKAAAKPAQKRKDGYEFPSLALLAAPKPGDRAVLSTEAIQENATALESVLGDFGVRGEIINAHPGPVVTLYELEPAPGIKSSRVIGLADDIARSMSKVSARVAVVPGATPSASSCPTRSARRCCCASCSRPATIATAKRACRSASARPSAAMPSSSTLRACRIC